MDLLDYLFRLKCLLLLGTKSHVVVSANIYYNYKKCFYRCICFHEWQGENKETKQNIYAFELAASRSPN